MSSKVSILMNCFNGEDYLQSSLQSIFSQTYQNYEIIFVDNFSDDRSIAIASSFDDKRLLIKSTPRRMNLGEARNFGTQYFSGKYLAFLDVDDLWMPGKLSKQVELMDRLNLVLTYGGARTIDANNNTLNDFTPSKDNISFRRLLYRYDINQQTVMIYIEQEPVTFIESKKYAPDNPLFMSIIGKHQRRCHFINEHLVDYRIHNNNLSKSLLNIRYQEGLDTLHYLKSRFPEHARNYQLEFFLAIVKKNLQIYATKILLFFKNDS